MDVISDADAKTIDLRFTTNGLMEVRSHDIDYGIVADVECQTNILGPGFHKLVVDRLRRPVVYGRRRARQMLCGDL
ncbi:MAG: hypothetical protein HFJ83_03570 [Muribaculaceae bacterium]|nr:hypothetical protein [Muribaculaceae bacterium]